MKLAQYIRTINRCYPCLHGISDLELRKFLYKFSGYLPLFWTYITTGNLPIGPKTPCPALTVSSTVAPAITTALTVAYPTKAAKITTQKKGRLWRLWYV